MVKDKLHEINGIQLFHLNHYGNSMKESLKIMAQLSCLPMGCSQQIEWKVIKSFGNIILFGRRHNRQDF